MRKPHNKQKLKSLLENGREFIEIITDCLLRTVPIPTRNTHCKISWQDVDKFNSETKDKRDPGKIKIDSEKFVTSIKHAESRTKELQLIALSKHVISANPDSVMGTNRYLMLQIIQNNGYQNYINNELIQEAANSPNTKISFQLKEKLLNTAKTVHLLVYTCKNNDTTRCFVDTALFSYLLASQPIQKVLLKKLPQFIDNLAVTSGKVLPKFLGHNTKSVIKMIGVKHGSKIVEGAFGAVGPVFDAISISIAAHDLSECNDRAETDNPCSSKKIRDHIATMVISGVSFCIGSILIAVGAIASPWGTVLGLGTIALTAIYKFW